MTDAPVCLHAPLIQSIPSEQDRQTLATLRQIGFPSYTPTGDVSPVRLPGVL